MFARGFSSSRARDGQKTARPKIASRAGKQCEAGHEHQRDADRERRTERLVEAELRDDQRHQRRHHDECAERDQLTDGRHRTANGVLRLQASAQFLAHSEDEEQAVVGSRAEHEDDEDELRDRRHLHPQVGCAGDDRAGEGKHQRRGQEGDQRREQRSKRDQQQGDDEEQRELLDGALRALRLTLLIDESRDRSREVNLEPGRVAGKRRADGFDQGDGVASGAEGRQVGDHLGLLRVLVGRKPEVLHVGHPGEASNPRFERADLLQVRRGEHAALSRRDQGRDAVLRVLERLREVLGLYRR